MYLIKRRFQSSLFFKGRVVSRVWAEDQPGLHLNCYKCSQKKIFAFVCCCHDNNRGNPLNYTEPQRETERTQRQGGETPPMFIHCRQTSECSNPRETRRDPEWMTGNRETWVTWRQLSRTQANKQTGGSVTRDGQGERSRPLSPHHKKEQQPQLICHPPWRNLPAPPLLPSHPSLQSDADGQSLQRWCPHRWGGRGG